MTDRKGDDTHLRTAFLERLAHELRGPAGVIHGALQELEAALGPKAVEHEMFLSMAKRGLRRTLRIADRLQHTGQLERGPIALNVAGCDVAKVVKQAVDEAQTLEARKKISVEVEAPNASALPYPLDSHWMHIAFYELASNAIRHASERVQVRVQINPGDGPEISFTDDGRGSTHFEAARFTLPRDGRGLGLGLAIVSDVVLAHNGGLKIEYGRPDNLGFGARVTVTLPPV
jgi:signal transduction histidine kinase